MATDFVERCDAIEECYEFMLAYAAQGLPDEKGSAAGGQIRGSLSTCDAALADLAELSGGRLFCLLGHTGLVPHRVRSDSRCRNPSGNAATCAATTSAR